MTYAVLAKLKKNSVSTTITGDIIAGTVTIPVAELARFYDADSTLITKGIVLGFDDATEANTEEITITGASGTSGAGNLTGVTRGVKADGSIGAAKAWSSGTKIAVMFSTGIYDQICDNIAAHESGKAPANPLATDTLWDATGDLVVGTGANTAGKVVIGSAGQVLTVVGGTAAWAAAAGGGAAWIQTTAFNDQAASTSTITMTSDLTGSILVGYPIKFKLSGSYYYAVCTAIASNLLTIAGAPLTTGDGDLTELWYGDFTRVEQVDIAVNGYYEDAANTALILSDLNTVLLWNKSKAYAVRYKVWSKVHDSHATHGKATVLINATELNTSADGLTIAADATWYSTVVDIVTAAYDINNGEAIELSVTKGGTGDAHDLTVSIIFVYP